MKIGVFCSSSNQLPPHFYESATQFGRWIGENGHTLVYGGSRCGLMEAVACGVRQTGSINVIGVVPKIVIDRNLVSEQIGIKIPTENLTDRKTWLMRLSDVFVAMPGSVGTLDEAFSVIGETSIGNSTKQVVFWNISGFWNQLFEMFQHMKETGVLGRPLDTMIKKADTLEELTSLIQL